MRKNPLVIIDQGEKQIMLKSILTLSAATACLALPATAESYVRGDGCGGTYIDRKSEMMAGNISGGTRYKCTPFPKRAAAVTTTPRTVIAAPRTTTTQTHTTQTYSAPRRTYSTGQTYSSGTSYSHGTPRYTHPSSGYVQTHPTTTYPSHGGYVTTQPSTTYPAQGGYVTQHPTRTYSQGGYVSGSTYSHGVTSSTGGHVTHHPHQATTTRTFTTSPQTHHSGTVTTRTQPSSHHTTHGTPRVTGNLANGFTTVTEAHSNKGFNLGKPTSFLNAGKH